MATFLKGLDVSGEYVSTLKDKSFTVLRCQYQQKADLDNPGQMKERLIIRVRISDGQELDYYPNKTSQKSMGLKWGFDIEKWIGKKATWIVTEQMVRKEMKKVLFVSENNNGKKKKRK